MVSSVAFAKPKQQRPNIVGGGSSRVKGVVSTQTVPAPAVDEQRARRSGRTGHLQTYAKASVAGVLLIAQSGTRGEYRGLNERLFQPGGSQPRSGS
jgi:hypothetical protein